MSTEANESVLLSERDKHVLHALLRVCIEYDILDISWAPPAHSELFGDAWDALQVLERLTKNITSLHP